MAGAGADSTIRLEARIRDLFNRIHLTLETARNDARVVLPVVEEEARALLERIGAPCGPDTSILRMPPQPPRAELSGMQRRFLQRYPNRRAWRENNPINTNTLYIPEPEEWMADAWLLNARNRNNAGASGTTSVGSKRPRTRKARRAKN
jgi:hypothetical protein